MPPIHPSTKAIAILAEARPIAGYIRHSKESQATSQAIASLKFQVRRAIEQLGGAYEERWIFADVGSGRKNQRPEFQRLLDHIKRGDISVVVVRGDRMTRDLGMNLELSRLFETTGVKLYDILKGRFVDFSDPSDWADYQHAGVRAEAESRTTSKRIKLQKEFTRSQGKTQGGRVPYGYRRSAEGYYEPNPETWEKAQRMVEICRAHDWATVPASRQIADELGMVMEYESLNRWLCNYVLRGVVPYFQRQHGRKRPPKIIYADRTHPALIDGPTGQQIDAVMEARTRQRGRSGDRIYPLSGLLFCGRCGSPMHLISATDRRQPGKRWTNAYCVAHRKNLGCAGRIGEEKFSRKNPLGTPYELANNTVIDALCARAAEVIDYGLSLGSAEIPDSPEVIKLREQIKTYEQLAQADPDLLPVLEGKRKQLTELTLGQVSASQESQEWREWLALYGTSPHFWKRATVQELATLYRVLVKRVVCAGLTVTVELAV